MTVGEHLMEGAKLRALRKRVDECARRCAECDPDGTEIEHANHEALVAMLALGKELCAQEDQP
jgi:hypothetical protein